MANSKPIHRRLRPLRSRRSKSSQTPSPAVSSDPVDPAQCLDHESASPPSYGPSQGATSSTSSPARPQTPETLVGVPVGPGHLVNLPGSPAYVDPQLLCPTEHGQQPTLGERHFALTTDDGKQVEFRTVSVPSFVYAENEQYLGLLVSMAPRLLYVFEGYGIMKYNPYRIPQSFQLEDPVNLQTGIMMGHVMDMTMHGTTPRDAVIDQIAKTCQLIGTSLKSSERDERRRFCEVHSIASMVIAAIFLRDFDSWRVHMSGLKQYLQATGGISGLSHLSRSILHYCDIEGAITFRSPLHLPFNRRFSAPLPAFSTEQLLSMISTLRPVMRRCEISNDVADTIIAVCIFTNTIKLYRRREIAEKRDPDNLLEEWYFLQHELLPSPDFIQPEARLQASGSVERSNAENGHVETVPGCSPSLDRALCVTALMYLRAPTMDFISGRAAYETLLTCLVEELQAFRSWMYQTQALEVYLKTDVESQEFLRKARPILIWICVVGHYFSHYFNVYHSGWSDRNPEGSIYFQILQELETQSGAVATDLTKSDVEFCHMLSMEWALNGKWDAGSILQRIVKGR
ncbi:hypothetical protein JX266_013820 [Neoarthrinium moseri]|nr:hypothetical protein JX266_013820 [Neoarthrinium moseri]